MATWDQKRPWTAPARSLVLYCPEGRWRFAIYNEAGILDGHMADLAPETTPEEAQAALVARVENDTGLKYRATWSSDQPGWWNAELHPLEDPEAHPREE